MPDTWLPHLTTQTPQEGFDLAIKLARMAVKMTQPDETVRGVLRPRYATDTGDLIAASHVVAVHFATIAAANHYWRNPR
ncbi:MAG: hexameric tyrosine-coordinated heme protein [Brucellaceae bacterium]|nr:hexameric tyrosine-coordinated heme protein [Brucellaceae bacterium]